MSLPRIVLGSAVAVALLLSTSMVAMAGAPMPTVIGAIPITFQYTYDEGDEEPEAESPTGIRLHYITPWYVGVGVAQYKSALKATGEYKTILAEDLGTTYKLIEISANYQLGPVVLTWGYGSGKVEYSPESIGIPAYAGLTAVRKESDVIERFLGVALMVSPNWSIQAAWHALYAEVDQEIKYGSTVADTSTGDIGAVMTTVGVGYTF